MNESRRIPCMNTNYTSSKCHTRNGYIVEMSCFSLRMKPDRSADSSAADDPFRQIYLIFSVFGPLEICFRPCKFFWRESGLGVPLQ